MELTKKIIKIHEGREIFILTPIAANNSITSGHNNKDCFFIWGNGSGYKFLADCFSISSELNKNEILYLPDKFKASDEFKETFSGCDFNFNIICINYCETQITLKDIEKVLQVKVYSEKIVNRSPTVNTEFIDRWKTYRRLTVKIHKKNMYISTNRDGFSSLACGAGNMQEYGDRYYEDSLPHEHYNWDENTSASAGVILYHWHDK